MLCLWTKRGSTSRAAGNRRLRAAGFCFFTLALVSHFASFAHLAAAHHVACVEHGELIDLGSNSGDAASGARAAAAAEIAKATQPGHGHSHCVVALQQRQPAPSTSSVGAAIDQPLARSPIALPAHEVRPPALALFRLAPKNSPPV